MQQVWSEFLVAFMAFFVAMDVVGILPIYLSMTQDMELPVRNRVVDQSILIGAGVAFVFAFVGHTIFKHLGIEIPDFKIAGGLVLLLIALADLVGKQEAVQRASGSSGIVPLGVPLITGPATLTTLILQISSAGYIITLVALILNYGISWLVLRKSHRITRLIGKDGTVVVSKLAALFLAAIAIAMIRSGVAEHVRVFIRNS